ncbi:MAG: DUF4232 domain-containing protein [Acidimicrobiales bacterium]
MSPRRYGDPAPAGRRWSRLPWLTGSVAAAALLLAGCSSGGSSRADHTTSTTSRSLATTTTAAGPTTTSGPATTTTTTGGSTTGTATCQPGQLSATIGRSTGAAGTQSLAVTFTDTSSAMCVLDGYPGMQLLDAQGAAITTTVVRGQFHFLQTPANQPPTAVRLAPQGKGTFALAYEDVPVGNETSCPTSSKAEITPPNDYTHLVVTLSITPCGNGTVHVSPVYAP